MVKTVKSTDAQLTKKKNSYIEKYWYHRNKKESFSKVIAEINDEQVARLVSVLRKKI